MRVAGALGWRPPILVASLLLIARPALAEERPLPEGVRLAFVRADDAADCITGEVLEREIARRMGRNPFAGAARQWIEGTALRQGSAYEVHLYERDAQGRTLGSRKLLEKVEDCRKLDDAIELAIALTIDPTAQLAPLLAAPDHSVGQPPPPPPVPSPGETPGAGVPRETPLSASGQCPALPACSAAPDMGGRELARPQGVSRSPIVVGRGARALIAGEGVLVSGVLPGVAPGIELVTRLPLEAKERASLRFSALYLPEKSETGGRRDIGYGLTSVEMGACASVPGNRVNWFGCGSFGVGAVHAVVHHPSPLEPGDRLWLSLRMEGGFAVRVLGPVWIETRFFDLVAPRRWDFRLQNANGSFSSIFRQGAWMPGAALGVGLKLD